MLPFDLFLLSFTFPKDNLGSEKFKQHEQWFDEKCSVIRSKEAGQIVVGAESKDNEWRKPE
jgi:hypothetical protein